MEESHHKDMWQIRAPGTDSMKVLDSDHGIVSESVTCSVKGAGHILGDGEEESEL